MLLWWMFIIMINVENSCDTKYFLWKPWYICSGFFDEQKILQSTFLFFIHNNVKVFTVTFDQFNASVAKLKC